MKYINLLKSLSNKSTLFIPKLNSTLSYRSYVTRTFVARLNNNNNDNISDDDKNFLANLIKNRDNFSDFEKSDYNDKDAQILLSKKLNTPPITSVPSMYRCSVNDPLNHDANHIGKFYKIDNDTLNHLDPKKELLEPQFVEQCKVFQENCFMIRDPAVEIINYIKNLDLSQPLYKFILYGEQEGTGKRSTVLHIMHYCFNDNWLLFTVPHASNVLRSRRQELEASTYKEGRIDTPIKAAKFLDTFLTQNMSKLKKLDLKTSKDYIWNSRERANAGKNLIELIEFGKSRIKYASDVCGVLVREIKLQAKSKQLKVLVMIDELNCFYGPTRLIRNDKSDINVDDLTMMMNFKKLFKSDWTNAVLIGIVNEKGVIVPGPKGSTANYDTTIEANLRKRKETTLHYEGPLTPAHLLKRQGFYDLEPFIAVEVPKYTVQEASNYFEYYKDRFWIQNSLARDDEGREELIFLSGRNPREFMRVCSML